MLLEGPWVGRCLQDALEQEQSVQRTTERTPARNGPRVSKHINRGLVQSLNAEVTRGINSGFKTNSSPNLGCFGA